MSTMATSERPQISIKNEFIKDTITVVLSTAVIDSHTLVYSHCFPGCFAHLREVTMISC